MTDLMRRMRARLEGLDGFDIAAMLTLMTLMLYGDSVWYARVLVRALCPLGIVFARVRRSPAFWLALASGLATSVYHDWWTKDNHKYLMAYWCLAMWGTLQTSDPATALRKSARWLIAGCFAFATFWKTMTPDFMDGRFFQFSLLFDERLSGIGRELADLSDQQITANKDAIKQLTGWIDTTRFVSLQGMDALRPWALKMAWWTVLIEGAVAVAFLAPDGSALAKTRNAMLLAFVVSTYLLAPVLGFACILLAMGLAQCHPRDTFGRVGYIAGFVALQFYMSPWKEIAGVAHGT